MASEPPRALVVEDDVAISRLITAVLRDEGLSVEVASHGVRALELLSAQAPDVLVLDLNLPLMSGAELLERLERDRLSVPTVVVSARQDARALTAAWSPVCVLAKPFQIADLVDCVQQALAASARPA